ncbi:arginine vasopressin-induced protein 1 isoform X1 [Pyrgilauda ruficollis]|uniref:arginine vasopressin-induced protein 1 isoform X1 n=2 Tax=Pyrgilauda ruficollis TaxID=221976 RepID=UPI001B864596|nr:arginine vasopressin-induced protein 1 isoform X1 [Pyrgilauda ruficollis]
MGRAAAAGPRRGGAKRVRERSGHQAEPPPPGLCEGPVGAGQRRSESGSRRGPAPQAGRDRTCVPRPEPGRLPRSRAAAPVRLAPCPASRTALPPTPPLLHWASAPDPGGGGPDRAAGREPDADCSVPAAAKAMGTPASVVSDSPGRAAPSARARKRASANIFQGVGLRELRSLFRSGGAERPEERARLVWRYAGQRRMARALRRLRRRRTTQPGGGMAALRRFEHLRIAEKKLEGDCGAETGSGSM